MICKNCGNELAEGALFCGVCGAKIANSVTPEQNTFANQDQYTNAPINEPDQNYMNNSYPSGEGANTTPATPKGKFPKKLLYIGLPIVAIVAAVALCFNSLAGFFIETFGSNAAYFAYVEGTSLSGYSEALTSVYGKSQTAISNGIGGKSEIKVELGDTLKTLLSSSLSGMDLNWLNQIKLVGDSSIKDNKSSGTLGLFLGEQNILTLEYLMDTAQNSMLIRCKELKDKYISIPFNANVNLTANASDISAASTTALSNLYSLMEYLPSEEELNNLLKKYVTIALKQITNDDVTKESGDVTANGISENCTVLKLKVTEKLLLNIAKAILTEAEDDKDLIAVIEKFEKGAKEISNASGNAVEEFKKGIADALENINTALDNLVEKGTEFFALTDYVNSSHEIIGREFSVNEAPLFKAVSAKKGSDIGYELTVTDQLSLIGTGKKSGNSLSGDYVLNLKGKEIFTISLENFSSDLKNYTSKGAIDIKLGKDANSLMGGENSTAISLLNLSLRMEMDTSAEKSNASIALLSGESALAKISLDSTVTEAKSVETPAATDIITYTEIDPSTLDFTKIIENLQKAGVPQNLLSLLQYAALAG